jgi:hypothetical protein
MAEPHKRGRVVILTEQYRILGEARFSPDGSVWDFRHRPEENLLTIYDAQFFSLSDGKRAYDSAVAELNRDLVVAIFREQDLGFMRKIE